ncbi:MAG: hypothetical protein ACKOAW_08890 [Actinomycetota bacterium]
MRARIPLVVVALGLGVGLLVLGVAAGWSPAVIAIAALIGLAVGALLGQTFAWVRITTGRLARLEHYVNHRLEGLKNDTSRRDDAMGKNITEIRGKVGKIDNELTFPRSTYRLALRELAQSQSAERRETRVHYQQKLDDQVALLESFMQLQRLVPMSLPMPRPGTWAASEDLLLWLAGYVLEHRPRLVVDLGSGQSSVWMAGAMRVAGYDGRVVGVDHEEQYARATEELGRRQGVSEWLTVVHAPLVEESIAGRAVTWYDESALRSLDAVDLLCVDGPPAQGAEQARWPALPFFRDRMSAGGRVILDDMIRVDEQQIAQDWLERYPGTETLSLDFEKGALVLTLP